MKYSIVLLLLCIAISNVRSFDFLDEYDYEIDTTETTTMLTDNGYVKGLVNAEYISFYGIPFAQPPVGNNRWQPPSEVDSWAPKVLDARYPQNGCPQNCELPPGTCPTNTSEDCLYLNVFIPHDVFIGETRAVMAFLPGGRFEQGAASSVLYTPHTLVNSSGIIVVTINYRLGALGFLNTPDFSGNYGFLDQRQALTWIQSNIHYFGGDPTRVTLAGQSAGATSIAAHLTSPDSWSLFHQVAAESNPFTLGLKPQNIAQEYSSNFAEAVGCSPTDQACLLAVPVDEVIQGQIKAQQKINPIIPLQSFLPWTPTVGGADIVDQPMTLFEQGKFYDVPMIMGTVAQEALLFIYQAANKTVDSLEYDVVLDLVFATKAGDIKKAYPPVSGGDQRTVLSTLGTNYIFVCPTRLVVREITKTKQTPLFYYQFDHVLSFDAWGPNYPYCVDAVCHGAEIIFIWNSAMYGGYQFTPEEQQLSYAMNNYWSNFVKTGNPNNGLSVPLVWPSYNQTTDLSMIFQTPSISVQEGLLDSECNYLDNIGYDGR